jgi:hypothetical protein
MFAFIFWRIISLFLLKIYQNQWQSLFIILLIRNIEKYLIVHLYLIFQKNNKTLDSTCFFLKEETIKLTI